MSTHKQMRVAVVGASGRVGGRVLELLAADASGRFSTPLALVRTRGQQEQLQGQEEPPVDAALVSVEHASVGEIARALEGCDAVVFSAGAGAKGGAERVFTVDLDGCVKTLEACVQAGVPRLVVVSALRAEDRGFWWDIPGLREYYIAKRAADHDVRFRSPQGLNYTIVQPGWLTDGEGDARFVPVDQVDTQVDAGGSKSVSRADVALFIRECLLHPHETGRKTIPLINGHTSMQDFISSL